MCIAYQGGSYTSFRDLMSPEEIARYEAYWKKCVDDIIKKVESGEVPLKNNIQKGNYGEMKMDVTYEGRGYNRVSLDKVTSLNEVTHHGIDGVYYNPKGKPPYIIGEAKYGTSKLATLADKTKQMSEPWIEDRLKDAVDMDTYLDIIEKGYKSELVKVSFEGNVIIKKVDKAGQVIK